MFIGLNHEFDLEGCDRTDMKLPYGQEELISAVLDANENTVIAVTAGSPVDMEVFADRAKAIVYSSYNGMEGGLAMAEVLLGRVNPSGRLPFTIPKRRRTARPIPSESFRAVIPLPIGKASTLATGITRRSEKQSATALVTDCPIRSFPMGI